MKRAILVSSGTLAGLVAVLTYSGGDTNPVVAAAGAGSGAGLGGPPPAESTDPTTAPPTDSGTSSPAATPSATTAASPTAAAPAASAKPAAAPTKQAATKATPTPTKAAPAPSATKAAPKPTPTPTPTPKPTVAVAKDYIGSLQTHKYGKVQVGIRVKAGKIIAVWPVVYPTGDSQPYSDFSIPVFKSETMKAQSANIANVSGATLTWQSWKTSLQSAMAKAGL